MKNVTTKDHRTLARGVVVAVVLFGLGCYYLPPVWLGRLFLLVVGEFIWLASRWATKKVLGAALAVSVSLLLAKLFGFL